MHTVRTPKKKKETAATSAAAVEKDIGTLIGRLDEGLKERYETERYKQVKLLLDKLHFV